MKSALWISETANTQERILKCKIWWDRYLECLESPPSLADVSAVVISILINFVLLSAMKTSWYLTITSYKIDTRFCCTVYCCDYMMTSSNVNIFRVTGHLCGEFTGHRWIPLTKASDAEFWCFLWSAPELTVEAGDLRHHRAHYDVTVMINFSISDTSTHTCQGCSTDTGATVWWS